MPQNSTHAEIVAIGNELISGRRLDTNSQWLAQQLGELGIDVRFHTTCGDDIEANVAVLRQAAFRSALVMITGGLGPTQDDLTRQAMAASAGVELVFDPDSLEHASGFFRRMGRPMPERNRIQAMFPAGSRPIHNAKGTAPGIWMERNGSTLVAMPGVPREMVYMFTTEVRPRLVESFAGGRAIVHRQINCFGAGESTVDERLTDLTRRDHVPEVGLTVHDAVISVHIVARSDSVDAANASVEATARTVYERLGELVISEGAESLEAVIGRRLIERGTTIAVAESCTGGLIGSRLTDVPGISASFLGGVVAYANEAKRDLLGVPEATLAEHGAVSPEVAEAMARGVRQRFGADLGLGITGIAGPGGGTPDKPVGLVFAAMAHEHGVEAKRMQLRGDREVIKDRAAKGALDLVRLHLLECRDSKK